MNFGFQPECNIEQNNKKLCCNISFKEMPEVGAVTFNDIEDGIVKAAGKIAVSEIFRSRDNKFVGKVAGQTVAPREGMNE